MLTRRTDLDGLYQDHENPSLARWTLWWQTEDDPPWFVCFRLTPGWDEAKATDWVLANRADNPPRNFDLSRVQAWRNTTDRALARGRCKEIRL